jgi:hypothetical protein
MPLKINAPDDDHTILVTLHFWHCFEIKVRAIPHQSVNAHLAHAAAWPVRHSSSPLKFNNHVNHCQHSLGAKTNRFNFVFVAELKGVHPIASPALDDATIFKVGNNATIIGLVKDRIIQRVAFWDFLCVAASDIWAEQLGRPFFHRCAAVFALNHSAPLVG